MSPSSNFIKLAICLLVVMFTVADGQIIQPEGYINESICLTEEARLPIYDMCSSDTSPVCEITNTTRGCIHECQVTCTRDPGERLWDVIDLCGVNCWANLKMFQCGMRERHRIATPKTINSTIIGDDGSIIDLGSWDYIDFSMIGSYNGILLRRHDLFIRGFILTDSVPIC